MDVLVVHASKHGSTVGIAQTVAAQLIGRGHAVTIFDAERADELGDAEIDRYDAVVLGSAIYAGHWRRPARRFIDHHGDHLAAKPLWLFSSGPLGGTDERPDKAVDVDVVELADQLHARDHRVFSGALDRRDLSLAERAVVRAVHAPYGDFRDTGDICEWADGIAEAIEAPDAIQPSR